MTTASERAAQQPLGGLVSPAADSRQLWRREALVLLFCAGFAATVFLAWSLFEATLLRNVDDEMRQAIGRLKDIAGPFLVAYVAARFHTSKVSRLSREMARERRRLEHIIATSADGIVSLDKSDRITSWNRGAERIFGYTADEVDKLHASVLYPPGTGAHEQLETLRHAVQEQELLHNHQGDRVRKDGRIIRTEISTAALRDEDGNYIGRTSIFRDVSERERMLDELARQKSLAAVGEMAAAVAHEIKNPLAGIAGAVRVIGRAFPEDDPRREVVDEIQNQVRRLDVTIRDLLTFSRPIEPRLARIDLKEFVDRILRVLGEEPILKRHGVLVDVAAGLEVDADPQLLENIMVNLLLNAGQAMKADKGRIVIHATAEPGETRIAVADNGPGIPRDVKDKLFKPFFTTKTRGTGLGLTIVRKFVEVMGGRIDVDTAVGEGTTFTVVLPEAKEE